MVFLTAESCQCIEQVFLQKQKDLHSRQTANLNLRKFYICIGHYFQLQLKLLYELYIAGISYFCNMSDQLDIIKELKVLLTQKTGKDIKDVVLYGSQIQKNRTEESDYDILIVLNRKYTWPERRNIRDMCYEISLEHDIIIDSKIISIQELQSSILKNHPLYQDALNQGIYA